MTIADGLMILSVLLAPLIAVQVQKYLERYGEARGRRLYVFKTLVATRAATVSPDHVQALNMIDLEFHDSKYKKVTDAWNVYRDHLNHFPSEDESQQARWQAEIVELLAMLLMQMGRSLGYQFDEVQVKRGIYSPVAHAQVENENRLIRSGMIALLQGDASLKMDIASFPVSEEESGEKALRDGLSELLEGKRDLRVVVSNADCTKPTSGRPTNK